MYNTLKKAKALVLLIALLVFFTNSSFLNSSETNQNDSEYIVITVENLDPYIYKDILIATRTNDNIELSRSCVPSKMLLFKKSNIQQGLPEFKSEVLILIQEHSEALNINIALHNQEQFNSICSESRVGQ